MRSDQGRNERVERGTMPRAQNHGGALKSLNNVASTFFNTNNPNIVRKYKTYRNKLTHSKEISKQNYYKQAFQKSHHDIKKKTWKLVNEIIAIKHKSQQKIGFLTTQNAKNNVKT